MTDDEKKSLGSNEEEEKELNKETEPDEEKTLKTERNQTEEEEKNSDSEKNSSNTEKVEMESIGVGPENITPQSLYMDQLTPKTKKKFNLLLQKNLKIRSALISLGKYNRLKIIIKDIILIFKFIKKERIISKISTKKVKRILGSKI